MKQPTEYELWKLGHKLSLRAFTEEEIFNFGFETGRQLGMEQERALQNLADSTQELENIVEEPQIPKNSKKK